MITRKKIEELVHLNQDHINREFKKQTGYTLMEYVQHYRILMAKKMLRETTLSISEISIRTGYDSPAYFSKIFKNRPNVHHWNIVRQKQRISRFVIKRVGIEIEREVEVR